MKKRIGIWLIACISVLSTFAEDGHQLWLRYAATKGADVPTGKVAGDTMQLAVKEYRRAISEMTGTLPQVVSQPENNAVLFATPTHKAISRLGLNNQLKQLGAEGYLIKTVRIDGQKVTLIDLYDSKCILLHKYSCFKRGFYRWFGDDFL